MKKSTKIIIAVVSVLVVVAAVLVTLYFTTDIFKGLFKTSNPKKAFYEYLDKAANGEIDYEKMLSKMKKAQDSSYEGKGKMSMNVEFGRALSEYDEIAEVLNNMEISFDSKVDPKNTNTYSSMNVKYDGKDLGTFEVISNEEEVGVKFDEITKKYLTLTTEEMIEILEDMGMDSSTSSMPSASMANLSSSMDNVDINEIMDILDISNDEITRIVDRYKKVLEDTIPEENYSSEKEKITVNGKEVNATGYSVEISDKDLVDLATKILESLKDDDDTITLVVEKANKLMELSGEDTKITKSQVKSMIEYLLPSLAQVDELTGEKMKITVYEYKDETVRIAISMGSDAIILDSMKDGDTTNMELKAKMDGTEMTVLKISETKKGDNKYTTTISTDLQTAKLEITIDSEESDSKEIANMKLYVEVPSMIKATLNIESEVEYKNVNIDKLSSSNSIAISSLSDAQNTELALGLVNYLSTNIDVIKDIANTLGYEDEIEEFENQLNQLNAQTSATTTTQDDEAA